MAEGGQKKVGRASEGKGGKGGKGGAECKKARHLEAARAAAFGQAHGLVPGAEHGGQVREQHGVAWRGEPGGFLAAAPRPAQPGAGVGFRGRGLGFRGWGCAFRGRGGGSRAPTPEDLHWSKSARHGSVAACRSKIIALKRKA